MTGKIDNINDAEKRYLEKIDDDKKALERKNKNRGSRPYRLLGFINRTEYNIFGIISPSKKDNKS